jgi:hypothetical protein
MRIGQRRGVPGRAARQNARVTDTRWPEFFIVGAPRAGTTSLWDHLDRHPQIFMSPVKEPHFFCSYKPAFVPTVSDEEEYLRLFEDARPGQLRGEASPGYLRDAEAPVAIARVRPDARILTVLRDPVRRAYSEYWHRVRYGRQSRPFGEVIRTALDSPQERTKGSLYLSTGLYAEGVERYLATFGDRVLVLFLEGIAADTRGELRRTLAFLGVDPDVANRMRLRVQNATAVPRNALVRRAYGSPGLRSIGLRVVPRALQSPLERLLLRRNGVPPMEPEVRRLLEDFYAPEVPVLEGLLGRAVPWDSRSSIPV